MPPRNHVVIFSRTLYFNIQIIGAPSIVIFYQLIMQIADRFAGKRILLTGTTGFVGKVMLQKFLYSLSGVDRIYVLIRNKEGSSLYQRFKKEIVSSPCFDRLRDIHKGKFQQFIQHKVHPIQGDLHKHQLGLSPQVRQELIETCNVVINCAASIDFNARLDQSIQSNIKGTLRMLELAASLKKLDVFTHVSTCYVNSDMRGLIKEEIYDRGDPQEQLKWLEEMPLDQLVSKTPEIIGKFPNTYTYTKSLCERLIKKRKGELPVTIVRPAIINTSYLEPFPGWIDSIAAAAALFMLVGLGVVHEVKGNRRVISDTVPVDVVVAIIIVASAFNFKNKELPIYHAGSSDRNPLIWGEVQREVVDFWTKNVSQSRMMKPSLCVSQSKWRLQVSRIKRTIPIQAYQRLSPLMGKQHQKNAQKMRKTLERGEQIAKIFEFFVINQWIFECHNFKRLWDAMSAVERRDFLIDVADIDYPQYIRLNNYGIQKYILKQSVDIPTNNSNLLKMHGDSYFSDIKWAWQTELPIKGKRVIAQMKTKILSSTRVIKAIEAEADKRTQASKSGRDAAIKEARLQAEAIIDGLIGEVRVPMMRSMAWLLHKLFKSLYDRVNINEEMLQQLRRIERESAVPIVLLPTHRSYFDFLIVSYLFFVYKLRLPYFIQDEAFLQSSILPFVARSCGAFFFEQQKYNSSRIYRIVFDKYVELLLREGNTLEFFIEHTRSRTGKILAPRFQVLNIVLQTMRMGKAPQVCIVPLTINYEKVFQGDTFPNELLGEEKVAESLLRVIKATPRMRENYGRVYVQICKPIMGKQFIEGLKGADPSIDLSKPECRKAVLNSLGKEIVGRMMGGIVIMSTAIVSSVLLIHRKGISEDQLIKTVTDITKYILKKGHRVGGVNENSSAAAVRNTIGHLSGITTKTKKNIFELTISAGDEFQKILMLSYYRNTLTHAFLPQAFVACALSAFGDQLSLKEGVPLARAHAQSAFLARLLREQHFLQYSLEAYCDFERALRLMADNQIVQLQTGGRVVISPKGNTMLAFYCSLLRPQIQSYWASLVYIKTMARGQERRQQPSSLNKFFDTVQWFMESLYGEKVIEDYEACSRELIKNAFEKFQKLKLIRMAAGGKKKEAVIEVLVGVEQIEGLQNQIKFFRRNVVSSVLSPMEVAKSSMKELALSKL